MASAPPLEGCVGSPQAGDSGAEAAGPGSPLGHAEARAAIASAKPAEKRKRKRACEHVVACEAAASGGSETERPLLKRYELVVRWGELLKWSRSASGGGGEQSTVIPGPWCSECTSLNNLHVCLTCAFTGCSEHFQQHRLEEGDHGFAVDFERQALFCCSCDDFAYDSEFESVRTAVQGEMKHNCSAVLLSRSPLTPTEIGMDKAAQVACSGLRGLRNLGNTCFMNVILQAMVHNPLLRSHYLSDRHNRYLCSVKGGRTVASKPCIACEVDKLFSEVYSGERKPFGPCSFLHSVWQCSDQLAAYKQHDAHEFFISVLNELHQNESVPQDASEPSTSCGCIVHRTYAGTFQSDVTCLRCGNVTTAHDPFLDISLDVSSARKRRKGSDAALGGAGISPSSLTGCLDRYTQSEKLGSKDYTCVKCNGPQEATKQVSFKVLPPVMSFQLKRFEHNTSTSKIDSQISFPAWLDLGPYVSRSGNTVTTSPQEDSTVEAAATGDGVGQTIGIKGEIMYDLFAVVNHRGKADTGHYTAFVQNRHRWFRADDHMIRLAIEKDVLRSQAYMLFYVKRQLHYCDDLA